MSTKSTIKHKQLSVRIPEQLFDNIQDAHCNFCNEHGITVSFNAFVEHLLQASLEDQCQEKK